MIRLFFIKQEKKKKNEIKMIKNKVFNKKILNSTSSPIRKQAEVYWLPLNQNILQNLKHY
jgi:hypothetical protein